MRYRRAGGSVGSGTYAGLVGEQSPLDPVHDAGAGEAAEDGAEIKGV